MSKITCPKCGRYVPGKGAADICSCYRNRDAHMESALRERDEARDALAKAREQHEYYRGKVSEFMGANQELSAALAEAEKSRQEYADLCCQNLRIKNYKLRELLERLHKECLVPNWAHDATGSCPICELLGPSKK